MTNRTDLAAKIRIEMNDVHNAMVDPGFDDFQKYREALSRYQALRWALQSMKLTEDDE